MNEFPSFADLIREYCEPNPKDKSKFTCPICNNSNLSVSKSGKWSCLNEQSKEHNQQICGWLNGRYRDENGIAAPNPNPNASHSSGKRVKRQSQRDRERELEVEAMRGFNSVEMKVEELAAAFCPEAGVTEAKLMAEIAEWAKVSKHDAYASKMLLKEKLQQQKASTQTKGKSKPSAEAQDNGEPVHKLAADYALIYEAIGDRLRFNTLRNAVELDGEPLEVETSKQELVIEHGLWLKSGKEEIADLVVKAAKQNSYNPIQDYLNKCHETYGDDSSILYRFAERYFGQNDPIYTIFAIRFLIGAVARVFEPGCKFDTALILQGGQGIRKSTFFKVLASPHWFDDSLGSVSDKDEKMKLHQTWFMEWAELETVFKRKDISSTKAFLSSDNDRLRLPYGRSVVEMKRRCVIVGTTNQDEFLNDVTGNRRFWVIPVKVPAIDTSTLAEERDRIWAAAVALYRSGEFWHLMGIEDQAAGSVASEYQSEDAWAQPIKDWLASATMTLTTANVLNFGLKLDISRQDKAAQMRVADILHSLGYEKTQKRVSGERIRLWIKKNDSTCLNLSQPSIENIDLTRSTLYQRFWADLSPPSQPSQPISEDGQKNTESAKPTTHSNGKNGSVAVEEKTLLGDVPVQVEQVVTNEAVQGFERHSQVVTPEGSRLGHPQSASGSTFSIGDWVIETRKGFEGEITEIDLFIGQAFVDGDKICGWRFFGELSKISD